MAIYDNNGTTTSEIIKLYDNNGSADTQIGKVYDNNGTTSSLIYSAEEQLYPGYTVSGEKSSGYTSWYVFGAKSANVSGGWAQAYIYLPAEIVKSFRSFRFEYYVYKTGNSQVFVGAAASFTAKPSDIQSQQYVSNVYLDMGSGSVDSTFTGSCQGGFNTGMYLGIQVYTGSNVGVVEAYITKIMGIY